MAHRIKAIAAYRPRINYGNSADLKEVVKLIVSRSTLNEGEVYNSLRELRDVVAYLCLTGRAVNLDGLSHYTPQVNLDGSYNVSIRPHLQLKNELNKPGEFSGKIINRDMIGKTPDELVALWNEEHPDDLVA